MCPDGLLPCPFFSTANALKALGKDIARLEGGDARAVRDVRAILADGVQVEWLECSSYLEFMVYIEAAQVQQEGRAGQAAGAGQNVRQGFSRRKGCQWGQWGRRGQGR